VFIRVSAVWFANLTAVKIIYLLSKNLATF